jgi:hypothetical protein
MLNQAMCEVDNIPVKGHRLTSLQLFIHGQIFTSVCFSSLHAIKLCVFISDFIIFTAGKKCCVTKLPLLLPKGRTSQFTLKSHF